MKVGIIIVFNSIENSSFKEELINTINSLCDVSFCLVNNERNEKTDCYLNDISDRCENTSVINIRRSKSVNSAIRAGARFMFNHYNLKHLGYINDLTSNELIEVIRSFKSNQHKIIDLVVNAQREKVVKQTLFQSLFSVANYIDKLNNKSYLFQY